MVSFAAGELRDYVDRLFGMRAKISPVPGGAEATIFLDAAAAGMTAPKEEQAFILRSFQREGHQALVAVGGSPVATMWAVYDLVERWGVRYLLHGDVFPVSPGPFHLPDLDLLRQPNLRIRGARVINLRPMSAESWGLADIKRYLDQLAKLKFTHMYHHLWCWQPYVHYECRGVTKITGVHWLNLRYPIDEHTIGRHLFGGITEFVPPDFQACHNYRERVEVGQRLLHATFAHAKARGMQTGIHTVLSDFPPEFVHILGMVPNMPHGRGVAISGHHLGPDAPVFQDLCTIALRAYIDTYPEVDRYVITMPEFRLGNEPFEAAWRKLDDKYNLSSVRTLEHILETAATRTDYPGGAERVVPAVKGDIAALYLFDQLLDEKKILDSCSKPDAEVLVTGLSEELTEVYNKMRPGAFYPTAPDYTSSRIAKRPHALERIRKSGLRPVLIMSTQDDNLGIVPQLCTASMHELMDCMRRYDWEGFFLRYWMINDWEPTAAYLSAACWDESVTVEAAYREHIRSVCG